MKPVSKVKLRQNDDEAITLLKASLRCFRNERILKYLMIFLSFGICLAAIFNKYLPQMAPDVVNILDIQQTAATYINLISGGIIVIGLVLGFYVSRMHTEGTVLQDRYEAYIFENHANQAILRPISQTYIDVYSKGIHRDDVKFKNRVYSDEDEVDDQSAQYEYIKKQVYSDYGLYLYIKPFFLIIWVGFCLLIMGIAVSFNDMFVTTLINIMIPSLSAITTIGSSWHGCNLQMKQLTNLINCIDRIDELPEEKHKQYIADKERMRLLADGLFAYRASAFVIPDFLVRRHQKQNEKDRRRKLSATEAEPAEKVKPEKPAAKPAAAPVAVKDEAAKPAKAPAAKETAKPASAAKETAKPTVSVTRITSVKSDTKTDAKPAAPATKSKK